MEGGYIGSPDRVWDRVLEELEGGRKDRVLRLAKPVQLTDSAFTLAVPAQFAKEIIEERYVNRIGEVVERELGRPVEIKLIVEEPEEVEEARAEEVGERGVFDSNLNPQYTFERFVVGPSNRIAYMAAMAVAENPDGKTYNPLFIYGGVGLGKTHLLHAIGNYIKKHHKHLKVLYVTSETFANDTIESIKRGDPPSLRNKYRTLDVLLIDDVQFLESKEVTQGEFFHTFNDLYNANKQIVLSSDSPPSQIASLPDRLRSRFQMGFVTQIRPPEFETRVAILRKKSEELGVELPDDVLNFIAEAIKTNIRVLEGALLRVVSYAAFCGSDVTLDLAQDVLRDVIAEPPPIERREPITISSIQKAVASYFKISVSDLKSGKRTKSIAWPRHIAMYLCRQLTNASLEEIGESFGGRDHSTVLHAINKIEEASQTDEELSRTIKILMENLRG